MRLLFAYLALALTISAVHAGEFQPVRRDHVNLKRFIKKRAPQFPPIRTTDAPAAQQGSNTASIPPATSSATSATGSTGTPSTTITSATSGTTTATSATTDTTGGLLGGIIGGITGSNTSSGTSTTTTETSTTSSETTSTTTTSTPTPPPQTSDTANTLAASVPPKSTVTRTATQNAASTASAFPEVTGAARTKSMTLMVIIIIASCIGGIAIVWTIFRKWKLGRSSKFDERLQPIDWQPTDDRDDGIVPAHRRAPSNASSFHSASAHGHPANPNHGTANLQPIPDHDFTAGTNTVGGYADLARGPSPQPPMGEIGYGAGMGYNNYNAGVPLHHQAGGYGYQGSRY